MNFLLETKIDLQQTPRIDRLNFNNQLKIQLDVA